MTTSTQVTPLVISFGNTLQALANGAVHADELKSAVFYMGHTEAHVLDPQRAISSRYVGDQRVAVEQAYAQFIDLLKQADADGRVAWRQPGQYGNSWEGLNDLLAANNLAAIRPFEWFEGYTYAAVERAITEWALPYKLIVG